MVTSTNRVLTTQVYQVFIKATPEHIWEAITQPEFSASYFHGARITADDKKLISIGPDGSTWMDDPVFEFDPPRKLVHQWRSLYDPECAKEEPSRVTWEIEPQADGVCKVTVAHDRLEGALRTAQRVSGAGWMFVLSGLKTLLETGEPLMPTSGVETGA